MKLNILPELKRRRAEKYRAYQAAYRASERGRAAQRKYRAKRGAVYK